MKASLFLKRKEILGKRLLALCDLIQCTHTHTHTHTHIHTPLLVEKTGDN